MGMKPRVLYLMQFIEKNSDEQHPVTSGESRKELFVKGFLCILSPSERISNCY